MVHAKRPAPKRTPNFIRQWREFRGMRTQGELAERSGITRATICRLESGTLPWRQSVLEKIGNALNCSSSDLISVDPTGIPEVQQVYNRIPENLRKLALRTLASFAEGAQTPSG